MRALTNAKDWAAFLPLELNISTKEENTALKWFIKPRLSKL